jgi:hypothetical protein
MAVVKTEQHACRLWSGLRAIKYKCDAAGEFSVDVPSEAVRAGASTRVTAKSLETCIRAFGDELLKAVESRLTVRRVICVQTYKSSFESGVSIGVRADVFDEETLAVGNDVKVTLRRPRLQEDRKGLGACWQELNSDHIGDSWAEGASRIPFSLEAQQQFERFLAAFNGMRKAIRNMMRTPDSVMTWALNPVALSLPAFSSEQPTQANQQKHDQ